MKSLDQHDARDAALFCTWLGHKYYIFYPLTCLFPHVFFVVSHYLASLISSKVLRGMIGWVKMLVMKSGASFGKLIRFRTFWTVLASKRVMSMSEVAEDSCPSLQRRILSSRCAVVGLMSVMRTILI